MIFEKLSVFANKLLNTELQGIYSVSDNIKG